MFVNRNSIIVALCLSFPSVSNGFCLEMAECMAGFNPKKASCTLDGRKFFACCSEDQENPEYSTATCSWVDADGDEAVVYEPPCYEYSGSTCLDPTHPVEASCNKTATYDTRSHGACCKKKVDVPHVTDPDTVCAYLSSAPTVGAWTVTAIGAVATTVVAFYGI